MINQEVLLDLPDKVRPEQTAVIVVDVQNDFCACDGWYARNNDLGLIQAMVPRLERFLQEAHRRGVLTILVLTHYSDHVISPVMKERLIKRGLGSFYCLENTWGADFYGIQPQEGDVIVTKHRHSSFFGTELDSILRNHRITTIIVTGVATNVCVESTVRDGFARDYYVVVLSDCTGALTEMAHNASLDVMGKVFGTVCRSDEVIDIWNAGGKPAG